MQVEKHHLRRVFVKQHHRLAAVARPGHDLGLGPQPRQALCASGSRRVSWAMGNGASVPRGTPQGAVISPLLAYVYLHYVSDLWAKQWQGREATGNVI